MKLSSAFPSKYLKAADLQGRRLKVTIESADMETIQGDGGKEDKLVVRFIGKDKGLVCNVTNANMIAEVLGTEETDDWINQSIVLYEAKVEYQGKRVPAIRVAEVPGSRPPPPPASDDSDSDDVSF